MKTAILLLCWFTVCTASAETVQISLPDLTGNYDSGFIEPNVDPRLRTANFSIPQEVSAINNLQVVMSGQDEGEGAMICTIDIGGGEVIQDTLSVITQMWLVLTSPTLDDGCFYGQVSLLETEFTDLFGWVTSCDTGEPLDLDLLLGTPIQAELECSFNPGCEPYMDTVAALTDVYLALDAEMVAADRQTWGQIKALYRKERQ